MKKGEKAKSKKQKAMSDIRNLLTAKDYSLIDMYREDYVSEDQVYHIGNGMVAIAPPAGMRRWR